jgi:hypothetical protein
MGQCLEALGRLGQRFQVGEPGLASFFGANHGSLLPLSTLNYIVTLRYVNQFFPEISLVSIVPGIRRDRFPIQKLTAHGDRGDEQLRDGARQNLA